MKLFYSIRLSHLFKSVEMLVAVLVVAENRRDANKRAERRHCVEDIHDVEGINTQKGERLFHHTLSKCYMSRHM